MKTSQIATQIVEKYSKEKEAIVNLYKTEPDKLSAYSDYEGDITALSIFEQSSNESLSPEMISIKNEIIEKIKTIDNYISNTIVENQKYNQINQQKLKELQEKAISELETVYFDSIQPLKLKNINFRTPITLTYSGVISKYTKEIQQTFEELNLFYISIENKDFIFFNSDTINSKELIKNIWLNFSEKNNSKNPDLRSYLQKNQINIFNPENPLIISIMEKLKTN